MRSQDITFVASAARTANGDTGTLEGFGEIFAARIQLDVTVVSGTTPTLNVVVEDTLDGTNWNVIGTFAQKTAAGREVINMSPEKTDSASLQSRWARRWRVRWTIGGTTPSFTFSVAGVLQS